MPSYIEIDKEASFPTASNVGKVVFGVNTSGNAVLVNNTGNITVIGSGGGGSVTPAASDYINVQSYNRWVYGLDAWSGGSKWDTIASEADQSDYLTFTFIGGTANGRPISRAITGQSATVDYTNLTYRDDGFGLFPVNYVDFINAIFQSQSLYTRITGSTTLAYNSAIGFTGSFCLTDDFLFIFSEEGQVDGVPVNDILYSIQGNFGFNICDNFSVNGSLQNTSDYRVIIENLLSNSAPKSWFQIPAP
jgi:hypothetical protein